ncbi:MAG: hypothetical protein Q4Q53_04885 [Methanocorpusculum sp.]|nr:hypothetical protein [Methanocorpusculum sp.]
MQAVERRKTVTISPEVHKKIVALRRGNQTYGDVVEMCIRSYEDNLEDLDIPYLEDLDLDQHIKEAEESEKDFEGNYTCLEDIVKEYEAEHNDK